METWVLILVILATDGRQGNVLTPTTGYASLEECDKAAIAAMHTRPITAVCIPGPGARTPTPDAGERT